MAAALYRYGQTSEQLSVFRSNPKSDLRIFIHGHGHPDIFLSQAACVVCCEADVHSTIDIHPFGVVIHALGEKCDPRHEAEGFVEVSELELARDDVATRHFAPQKQFLQRCFPRRRIELFHEGSSRYTLPSPRLTDCKPTVAMGLSTMSRSDLEAPSLDDLEQLARSSFAELPLEFRALVGDIAFVVQDFPDDETVRELGLESEFELLGLFHGSSLAAREANRGAPEPTMILLYRRPILDYWVEHKETLGAIVRHVLVHEIGHHFGLSDDAMHAIEEGEE
jgi:predicted Zn-dependent protease with MMP-like domain